MTMRKIFLLLSMMFIGFSSIACSDDETSEIAPQKKYPLTAFAVKVGNSFYHGKINQTTHKVEIGGISDAKLITEVDYTLFDGQTTISPDPTTFIDNWKKEQTVTVSTPDGVKTTYTIALTKFDETVTNLLFSDDFDVDGNPDPDKWVLCQKNTSDWCDEMSESYDQAYVEDGKLILKAELVDGEYKAGGIETNGKFNFTYGKVEVKIPDGTVLTVTKEALENTINVDNYEWIQVQLEDGTKGYVAQEYLVEYEEDNKGND